MTQNKSTYKNEELSQKRITLIRVPNAIQKRHVPHLLFLQNSI